MAKCPSCNKDVSYLRFLFAYYDNFSKNWWKSGSLYDLFYVYTCNHCHEKFRLTIGSQLLAIALLLLTVGPVLFASTDFPRFWVYLIILCFLTTYIWWHNLARTK